MRKSIFSKSLGALIISFAMLIVMCIPAMAVGSIITEAQAKKIVLKDAGLKEKQVIFLNVETVTDEEETADKDETADEAETTDKNVKNSVTKYELAFYHENTAYEYTLDAATGEILDSDKDEEFYLNPGALPSSTTLP
ncbi:MAG: hypothetical protein IJ683_05685 [Butyrivibrio sp.]|nr:hypothetical protein [Butyrivibrio sp.]MBR1641799.1 hypothetical protein [Butyrivibrio sp.]